MDKSRQQMSLTLVTSISNRIVKTPIKELYL